MNKQSIVTVGTAVEPISLPEGSVLSGYPNPTARLARGAHDQLEANALFIRRGDMVTLLLSVDVLGLDRDDVQIVKGRIEERIGVPANNIFICCTHTHSSGSTTQLKKYNERDEPFIAELLETLVRAADRAGRNFVPAAVKVAKGQADLGHNRRVVEDGVASNVWNDPERIHTGPVDKEVGIVLFVDDRDRILAMIVNYSCHPVNLGPGSAYASADFPGYARNKIRQSLGNIAILYTTGAAGDINPYEGLKSEPSMAREMGEKLAQIVRDAMSGAREILRPCLVCLHRESAFIRKQDNQESITEFQLLTIGDELAFISLPGEPLVEIGLKLKELSRYRHTFVLGYTNDYRSYLVTRKAVREGGYEASISFNDEIEGAILSLGKEWLDSQPGQT